MTETVSITPADIEAKFREIQGQVDVVTGDTKRRALLAGIVAAVFVLLLAYVLGRRAGKRRSTVVEIRRL